MPFSIRTLRRSSRFLRWSSASPSLSMELPRSSSILGTMSRSISSSSTALSHKSCTFCETILRNSASMLTLSDSNWRSRLPSSIWCVMASSCSAAPALSWLSRIFSAFTLSDRATINYQHRYRGSPSASGPRSYLPVSASIVSLASSNRSPSPWFLRSMSYSRVEGAVSSLHVRYNLILVTKSL